MQRILTDETTDNWVHHGGCFLLPMVGTCTVRMCELPQYSIKIEMVGFNVGLDALKHLDDFP